MTKFSIDAEHLTRQRAFSARTFGPGKRLEGVLDHIRKELVEVEAAPDDISEWADILILAFDGALRQGHEPQQILDAVLAKQNRNESRVWPDWRTQPLDKAIEHVGEGSEVVEDGEPRKYIPRPFDDTTTNEGGVIYPFFQGEDGDTYGLGHLDPARFAELVTQFDKQMIGSLWDESETATADDVQHVWARCFLLPARDEEGEEIPGEWMSVNDEDGYMFTWDGVTSDTQYAFPLTIVLR